jgi:hypothetical protein
MADEKIVQSGEVHKWRQTVVQKWITFDKYTLSILDKSDESKVFVTKEHQTGLVVSEFDSRSISCGFKSYLIQYTRWKGFHNHARIEFCTQFWFI